MKRSLFVLLLAIALAGCAKKDEPAALALAPASAPAAAGPGSYLAYQHSIQLDTEEHQVAVIFAAAQAACREAAAELCTVMESHISSGRAAAASLKFRAKPAGIRRLIAALSSQAEVTDQSTTAEDLAHPIEDAARKLAMLRDYRAKLEALRGRAGNDVDALIKVHRELSQVQSELEAVTGQQAHLMQRVETEILNVAIGSLQNRSFWRPIALALADFGANLSRGVAIAVTGVAYLIPWALLLLAAWLGRRLWRRQRDRAAATPAPAAGRPT